ncbi:Cytosolic Fe-S cluster assembly factor nar1 [Exophiala dermatitidis]
MSAILSADDLNDFISPGVACIKLVETLPKQEDYNPYEVTTEDKVAAQNPAPASISLTDCLACSGCVTSAEAVLVSLQSHTEVLNTLDSYESLNIQNLLQQQSKNGLGHINHAHTPTPIPQNAKLFVASVSPQVRASLAATYGISERKAGFMIEQFLSGAQGLRIGGAHNSSFTYVVDTNQLREACLVLGAEEVSESLSNKKRPVLTSACPGWICYAEKTHPHVLPHLSSLKSPQALSGTLLKSVLSKTLGIHPSQIWHLAIMPCFDKKLEASREELTDRWWRPESQQQDQTTTQPVRDVDCVITSRELLSLAEARNIQLSSLPLTPLERPPFPDARISNFLFPSPRRRQQRAEQSTNAGSSGGYLYHIMATEQANHHGSTISIQRGRNADVVEYFLQSPDGQTTLMKCARYYGFRNIQNLVRKLKPVKQSRLPGAARRATAATGGAADYAYVEVMACPGGCTNGGGQIKVDDVAGILPQTRGEEVATSPVTPQAQKEWLKRVDEAYYSAESDFDSDFDENLQDHDNNNAKENNNADVNMANGHVSAAVNGTFDTPHVNNNHNHNSSSSNHSLDTPGNVINGINVSDVQDLLHYWAGLVGVPLEKLAYTTFRQVESDVGKNKANGKLSDTERIAQIAGMSGGGW